MLVAEMLEHKVDATQAEIVEYLEKEYDIKVTQQTVSNDLKALKQVHWQRSHKAMLAIRDRLLGEYQTIYTEAMSAWYLSLENKEIIVTESISKPETQQQVQDAMERLKAMERTEAQSGNPALLAQARGALQDIEDLLGLEEPKKQDIDLTSGGQSLEEALSKSLIKTYGTND